MKTFYHFKIIIQLCMLFCLANKIAYASVDSPRYNELELCLMNDWGVDRHTSKYLIKKFQLLVEKTGEYTIIDNFIITSKNQKIDYFTPREVQALPSEDAILCAPKHHLVIFENLYVRILWGSTLPDEREPFHLHTWKSVMLVLKPTIYQMEYSNGETELWHGEIGVYELPPNERYACTNVGEESDEIIRFEIKESQNLTEN